MGWFSGKKPRPEAPKVLESAIPRDEERYGPAPPPPRTAHAPGVTVHAFAEVPAPRLLRLGEGDVGFCLEGEEGKGRASALLVLVAAGGDPSPGDVAIWKASADLASALPRSYSFEALCRTSPEPPHLIRRDGLAGRGVAGLAGLRLLHAGDGLTILRLGPPPGARWVFVGLEAIAVFAGRLTLVDGDEPRLVSAGRLALVADSTATLYVEAGNDSALAVALGGDSVVSALG